MNWMGSDVTDRTTFFWMVESWHEWELRLPTGQTSEWWRVDMNGKRGYRQDNLLNGGESKWMGSEVTDRTTFWMVETWHEWEGRLPTEQSSHWWRIDTNGKRGYRQDNLLNGGELTWMGSEVTDRTNFRMVEHWHEWEARSSTGQPSEWWRVDMNWMESEITDRTTFWMVESWYEWEARSSTGQPSYGGELTWIEWKAR